MTIYHIQSGKPYEALDSRGRHMGGVRLVQHEAKMLRLRPDKFTRYPGGKDSPNPVHGVDGGIAPEPIMIEDLAATAQAPEHSWAPGTGLRYNSGKPRMDLIPPEALVRLGQVLAKGAEKYAERNWELGMDRGKVIASAMRHLVAYMAGEKIDSETGLPHAALLLTNAAFLVAYDDRGTSPELDTTSPYAVVVK